MLRTLFSRIRGTLNRRRPEEEFNNEINSHLELLAERFIARGMAPAEARYAAHKQFGGITQMQETWRDRYTFPQLSILVREVRQAFRQLRTSKGFAVSASLTIALGIAATTAVFSVVDAVLLRPLPYAEPERLLAFGAADERGYPRPASLSYPEVSDFRAENQVFSQMVSFRDSRFTLADSVPPVEVMGEIVSWNLFQLLGVQPELGRGFVPEDEKAGTAAVVLSHSLWKSRYGGDPGILGRSININGRPYDVVGVAKADFQFPLDFSGVQLWVTVAQDISTNERGARMLDALGRLKPGVTIKQARQQLSLVANGLATRYPEHYRGGRTGMWVHTELERLSGSSRTPLWVLLAAVALLLLIACANVANLILARSSERGREFALRTALGASRATLIRQLVLESLVLGAIGAAAGLLLALAALSVLPLSSEIVAIPRILQAQIDGRVFAFCAAVALLTSILFSLAPARNVLRVSPIGVMNEGAANVVAGRHRLRGFLVVAQIALGLVLLDGAQALMASYLRMTSRDLGFRPGNLLVFDIGHVQTPGGSPAFSRELIEQLQAIPGVQTVGIGRPLPLQGHEMRTRFDIEGRQTAANTRPRTDFAIVTPRYFVAMGIALRKGREFSERDTPAGPPVVIVNETFARQFFPGEDVIGKRIQPGAGEKVMREIVGVVGDALQAPLSVVADPICYFPYQQLPWGLGTVVLRTAVPPLSIEPAVRDTVGKLAQAAISRVRTGDEISANATALVRFPMLLVLAFAAVALALTVTGLYGVTSYAASRRHREIGLRIALGAGRPAVLAMVMRDAGILLAAGLMLGSAGAFGIGRVIGSAVSGIQRGDAWMLAGACLLMAATSLGAAYLPAARAASVDPMKALRTE